MRKRPGTPWKLCYELATSDLKNHFLSRSRDAGGGGGDDEEWSARSGRLMTGFWLEGLIRDDRASWVEVVQGRV